MVGVGVSLEEEKVVGVGSHWRRRWWGWGVAGGGEPPLEASGVWGCHWFRGLACVLSAHITASPSARTVKDLILAEARILGRILTFRLWHN